MSPSYEPAELARYRDEYPEEWQFPDEVVTGTFHYARAVLGYRIEDLGRVAGRGLRRDLARLDAFIVRKRDQALRRWWRS